MPRIFAVVLFLIFNLQAGAAAIEASGSMPLRKAGPHDSTGELSALLIVTPNGEAVVKEWTSTPEAHTPSIRTTDTAKPGDTLTVMLFFSGCLSTAGDCSAEVDYQIYKPDGTIYADLPNIRVWAHGPLKPRIIYLSPSMIKVHIEANDPLGEYTVRATFRAPGSERPLRLQQAFTVSR